MLKRDEVAGGITIFLFGLLTAILSSRMPVGNFRAPGTGLFPLALGLLLMLLSLLFLGRLLSARLGKSTTEGPTSSPKPGGRLILFFGATVLSVPALKVLGFALTSGLLLFSLMAILGVTRWRFSVPFSFAAGVACQLFFVEWLKIPLPGGLLGF